MLTRVWPGAKPNAAPPILLGGAVLAGAVGAAVLAIEHAGLNLLLTALAIAVGIAPVARNRINRTSVIFAVLTFGLVAMAVWRDAGWIVALCVVLAIPIGSYALAGGKGWTDLLLGGFSLPLAGGRMLPWMGRGIAGGIRAGRGGRWPVTRALIITGVLVLVFGGLLASADAAFSKLTDELIPDLEPGMLFLRGFLFLVVGGVALAAAFLALAPPRWGSISPGPGRPAKLLEWTIPLGALNALFLLFAGVQATVLLTGDRDALLRSTGLTYAEYARQGFFQLVVTTVLVIGVMAVAVRKAPRETGRDRTISNALMGLLCGLTLLIVAVALGRMRLYELEYGLTRLRLWVSAFELWLGLVITMIAVASMWRKGKLLLPRAVAATGAAGLFALGALNPDALIAERNVDRFQRTHKIDTDYLSRLSADAVPALDRLPEPRRSCALRAMPDSLYDKGSVKGADGTDEWYTFNLGRHRARAVIEKRPPDTTPEYYCSEASRYRY